MCLCAGCFNYSVAANDNSAMGTNPIRVLGPKPNQPNKKPNEMSAESNRNSWIRESSARAAVDNDIAGINSNWRRALKMEWRPKRASDLEKVALAPWDAILIGRADGPGPSHQRPRNPCQRHLTPSSAHPSDDGLLLFIFQEGEKGGRREGEGREGAGRRFITAAWHI